jgi:acetyl/propionyl-CoA carboxylase alpha subunit
VEHAVTEAITGIDLCKEMIGVAAGQTLSFLQDEIRMRGHAIECHISAEDTDNGFLPSSGEIADLRVPEGPGVRSDSLMYQGLDVPPYYESLLSKVVVWDRTREGCIARATRALSEYSVSGIKTTIPLLERVVRNGQFMAGDYDATFLDAGLGKCDGERQGAYADAAVIAAVIRAFRRERQAGRSPEELADGSCEPISAWKMSGRVRR